MATIKSNSLFHFTHKEEYLLDILENGFWPRYCFEDIEWLIPKDLKNELEKQEEGPILEFIKYLIKRNISSIAYPMSCFVIFHYPKLQHIQIFMVALVLG